MNLEKMNLKSISYKESKDINGGFFSKPGYYIGYYIQKGLEATADAIATAGTFLANSGAHS